MKYSVHIQPNVRAYAMKKSKRKIKQIDRDRTACKKARIKLRRIFVSAFKAMADDVAKQIAAHIGKVDQSEVDRILHALNLTGFAEIVGDLDDAITEITKDGAYQALVQIGIAENNEAMVNQVNEKAVVWAKDRAAEMVGKKWINDELVDNPNESWTIEESTREMLRADVADAIDQGWSNDTLAENLTESYAFSDDRAEMIARTETAFADVQGNVISYRESGLVSGKEWITAEDDLVSDDCQANADEGEIPFEQAFESGADFPPEHPNCRCDVIPVLIEDESNQDNQEE